MQFKSNPESKGGGSLFLKLSDGDAVQGVFRGDPHEYYQHWVGGKSVVCNHPCAHCKAGDEAKFRFRINFVLKENGAFTAKIFETGAKLYRDLKELHEADYNLEETLVRLKRKGTKLDTEYSVIPSPKKIDAAALKALSAVELKKLTPQDKEEDVQSFEEFEPTPF